MEPANAFLGRRSQPTEAEVSAVLGTAGPLWKELIEEITTGAAKITQEWQGIYANKYGWSLRLRRKGRNIIYMAPCNGCFRVAFALSDNAVKAARAARLPKRVAAALAEAPHYPEGTGLRLTVEKASDLKAIRKLAQIKLAG